MSNIKSLLLLSALTTGIVSTLSACTPNSSSVPQEPIAALLQNADTSHWLTADTLALSNKLDIKQARLITTLISGEQIETELTKHVWTPALSAKYPHLKDFSLYRLANSQSAKALLKGQNVVYIEGGSDVTKQFSRVQTYGVLDELYTSDANDANEIMDFGATVHEGGIQFKLWAPTATSVEVLLFDKNKQPLGPTSLSMYEDSETGSWLAKGSKSLEFSYYQYRLRVFHPVSNKFETLVTTDPYSLSLSTNSRYSQIIDLDHPNTQPKGWLEQQVPTLEAPEDLILYETHIRDFSASEQKLSNPAFRGKYKAFSETDSYGIEHLTKLRDSGLNTVHLLPTYDISTVDEAANVALSLDDPLSKACSLYSELAACNAEDQSQSIRTVLQGYNPRTGDAQKLVETIRDKDDYNWGYDPFHYTVPEGSYAVNPEGEARIIEFREMVTSLHNMGFRVIMDVVYNHTFQSGLGDKSVLDKIVPGYYHRYNVYSGDIEMSTCCDNSATEHAMMEKLMTDSLVVWARDHKIDGFRFDLMGHQPKDAMLRAREAVKAVDPDTYFYGEGWNFGEVANNAQFVQASQTELSGTEIGTFTDRLRDAVRGGNFQTHAEGLRRDQGIGNGLYVIPNELQPELNQIEHYYNSMDIVRLGLAANLKQFEFESILGERINGTQVLYGGNPAGYASDPADTINYVSKHDNQSLWDNHQYRLPFGMPGGDRVRVHNMSLSYPLMAQGIPFLHMGSELMRSKSFLRDSYDYGDWFNAVDFSYQSNNYDVGLPPEVKDRGNWPIIKRVLKHNKLNDDVTPMQIEFAANVFSDFIKIRTSSKLFRLRNAEDVLARVEFLNDGQAHQNGLIVMKLSDEVGQDLDPNFESILVVFNQNPVDTAFELSGAAEYRLHPVQQSGHDEVVKRARASGSQLMIPALTTAVFVR